MIDTLFDIIKFGVFLFIASVIVLWFMNLGENKGKERAGEAVVNAFHTTWVVLWIFGCVIGVGLALVMIFR